MVRWFKLTTKTYSPDNSDADLSRQAVVFTYVFYKSLLTPLLTVSFQFRFCLILSFQDLFWRMWTTLTNIFCEKKGEQTRRSVLGKEMKNTRAKFRDQSVFNKRLERAKFQDLSLTNGLIVYTFVRKKCIN